MVCVDVFLLVCDVDVGFTVTLDVNTVVCPGPSYAPHTVGRVSAVDEPTTYPGGPHPTP